MRAVFCHQLLQRDSRSVGPQWLCFLPSSKSESQLVSICLWTVMVLSTDMIITKYSLKPSKDV